MAACESKCNQISRLEGIALGVFAGLIAVGITYPLPGYVDIFFGERPVKEIAAACFRVAAGAISGGLMVHVYDALKTRRLAFWTGFAAPGLLLGTIAVQAQAVEAQAVEAQAVQAQAVQAQAVQAQAVQAQAVQAQGISTNNAPYLAAQPQVPLGLRNGDGILLSASLSALDHVQLGPRNGDGTLGQENAQFAQNVPLGPRNGDDSLRRGGSLAGEAVTPGPRNGDDSLGFGINPTPDQVPLGSPNADTDSLETSTLEQLLKGFFGFHWKLDL